MRAAVFPHYGRTDVLEIASLPRPVPGRGELLIKVHTTSINPKDTFVRKGTFKHMTGKRFPMQTGYDFAGVVVASPDPALPAGSQVFGMINGWHGRAMAEYLTCHPDEVALAPRSPAWADAAALPIAALTALQALRDHIKLKPGQTLLVNGASGGVGSYAVQIAKAMGAQVTAIASAERADYCRSLGADQVWDYANGKLPTQGGFAGPYDGVFDVFGNLGFAQVRPLLNRHGHYVTTVPSVANVLAVLKSLPRAQRSHIVNVRGKGADLAVLADMVERGVLNIGIDARYALEQISDAHRHVERKHTQGKVLVVVTAEKDA